MVVATSTLAAPAPGPSPVPSARAGWNGFSARRPYFVLQRAAILAMRSRSRLACRRRVAMTGAMLSETTPRNSSSWAMGIVSSSRNRFVLATNAGRKEAEEGLASRRSAIFVRWVCTRRSDIAYVGSACVRAYVCVRACVRGGGGGKLKGMRRREGLCGPQNLVSRYLHQGHSVGTRYSTRTFGWQHRLSTLVHFITLTRI